MSEHIPWEVLVHPCDGGNGEYIGIGHFIVINGREIMIASESQKIADIVAITDSRLGYPYKEYHYGNRKPIDKTPHPHVSLIVNSVNAFAALADYLGCDPQELESLDLVEWLRLLKRAEFLMKDQPSLAPAEDEAAAQIRQALAKLPEKCNDE